jgi:cell division septal protein FtsQ
MEIALGRAEPEVRLARFASLYARTAEKLGVPPAYVDLRYADGFAVRPSRGSETVDKQS